MKKLSLIQYHQVKIIVIFSLLITTSNYLLGFEEWQTRGWFTNKKIDQIVCYDYEEVYYNLGKSPKINELKELEIVDSIDIDRDWLLGITFGDGFLWVLKAKYELEYDSVFKIDPITKQILRSYRLPGERSNWHQGIAYDSTSTKGHYLYTADDGQGLEDFSIIYKIQIENFEVIDTIIVPIRFLNAIAYRNDSLWLSSGNVFSEDSLFIYDIINGKIESLFLIPDYSSDLSFGEDEYKNPILWISEGADEQINYLQTRNPYTGIVLNNYKSPGTNPVGLCWENQTNGGPFLWVTDFETNMIYKIQAPIVSVVEDNIDNDLDFVVFPHPFSNKTKISFNLEEPSYTKFTIFNSLGYVLDVLVDEYLSEGTHEFTFDGSSFASGTYYYVLQSNGKVETGQLVLIK